MICDNTPDDLCPACGAYFACTCRWDADDAPFLHRVEPDGQIVSTTPWIATATPPPPPFDPLDPPESSTLPGGVIVSWQAIGAQVANGTLVAPTTAWPLLPSPLMSADEFHDIVEQWIASPGTPGLLTFSFTPDPPAE